MDDIVAYVIADIIRPNTPFSRSKIYQEIGAGRLKARKLGRRTIIVRSDFEAWIANLPGAGFASEPKLEREPSSGFTPALSAVAAPIVGERNG